MRRFSDFTIIVATIFSTIIHFFVLTLLDTIPMVPKDITPRAELFMVDLISLKTARAVPQEKREVTVEKKIEKVEKQEAKKEKPPKKEVKKEPIKKEEKKEQVVLADHNKKAQENKKKPKVDNEQQMASAIKGIEERVAGREAKASAAEIQHYPVMVESRVKGFWVIPDTLSTRELKAVVVFAIDKNGDVINLRFKESSGSLPYDQSVIRAISKASPFSPPPPVLLGEEFEVTFQP